MIANPENTRWHDLKQRLRRGEGAWADQEAHDKERLDRVYQERAIQLARPAATAQPPRDTTRVLEVELSTVRVGIELRSVARVLGALDVTSVPRSPKWLAGIANFEGQIRSVLNLGELLAAGQAVSSAQGNTLLIRAGNRLVGLRVDQVGEIRTIDLSQLAIPDPEHGALDTRLVRGVTPQHMILIRADAICELLRPFGDGPGSYQGHAPSESLRRQDDHSSRH